MEENKLKAKFNQLQNQLRDRWGKNDLLDRNNCDILVIPSFSIDPKLGGKIAGFLHYEERLLFSFLVQGHPVG